MSKTLSHGAQLALVCLLGCQARTDEEGAHAARSSSRQAAAAGRTAAAQPPPPSKVPSQAEETTSGLRSVVLHAGTGAAGAEHHDEVSVVLAAWSSDGQAVDGITTHGRPRRFAVADLFFGLAEGVGMMREGERRRLWIPAPLVQGGTLHAVAEDLVMEVALVSIHRGQAPPSTPTDLAVPRDALRTESGLAYKVLEPGSGTRRPGASDRVRIAYSAWTQSGVMFRTNHGRRPSTVPVSGLIPGWSEGVQRMVEGERTRFWIPQALAYDGQSGQPRGTIVLDVHLLEVVPPRP